MGTYTEMGAYLEHYGKYHQAAFWSHDLDSTVCYQELMSGTKERPTAHHCVQQHSPKYLDHHYLIRKMFFKIQSLNSLK